MSETDLRFMDHVDRQRDASTLDEIDVMLAAYFGVALERWCAEKDQHRGVNADVIGLAGQLAAECTVRVGMITNIKEALLPRLLGQADRALFDPLVQSCDVGFRKPGPLIYMFALKEAGIEAPNAVLIDDKEINCRGARDVGMHAIRFSNYPDLLEDLQALGVVVPAGILPGSGSIQGDSKRGQQAHC